MGNRFHESDKKTDPERPTTVFVFDIDGTICESGKPISPRMASCICQLPGDIALCGGGVFSKIMEQMAGLIRPKYIFSECGSVMHEATAAGYEQRYTNNLRKHPEFGTIQRMIQTCLAFIAEGESDLLSGHFIDLRQGLVYVSLVGMQATDVERAEFVRRDAVYGYRAKLMQELIAMATANSGEIEVCIGGSVGIAIYPKEWGKLQILEHLPHSHVHYFGDRYEPGGNDHAIMNHPRVLAYPVDSVEETRVKIMADICII